MRNKIERTQAQIEKIHEEQGTNIESESELRRLQQLKKKYQKDLENAKKEVTALEKQAKTKDKNQKQKPKPTNLEQAWRPKRAKETPWNRGSTTQERWMS